MSSSPWAKIEKPEPVKLEDIMSEEVARDLQAKENQKYYEVIDKSSPVTDCASSSSSTSIQIPPEVLTGLNDYESDATIAQMLQMQYDREYDEMLKKTEDKFNGSSKVSISFDNYRRTPRSFDFESDSEEEEIIDIIERKNWDRFDALERDFTFPPCGYKMMNGKMVTKHDGEMCGRKNACKMLSFPPEFQTGDGEGFDLKLSNKVYNSLLVHSKQEQARRHRMHDRKEDHATAEFGMDQYTRLLLYKMINKQLLKCVNGVISIGKEAVILHADSDPSYTECELPKECVLKIYKTTLSEFKQRDKYIKDDHRFKDRIGKQTSRKTIQLWAEKEMANLMRLKRAGILCPQVVTLKQHVLVMSFIGDNHKPAPKLKDAVMTEADYIVALDEIANGMKKLYENANLIHADLSEYNILWHDNSCYFIDVSQSVEPSHENAFHFLFRDCNNIVNFFNRKKVPNVYTPEELFILITGFDFHDKMALSALQETFKLKPHLVDKAGVELSYNFETAWENSKLEKTELINQTSIVEPPKA